MNLSKDAFDVQWLPSDADMINWVERGYTVRPYVTKDRQNGWAVRGLHLFGPPCGEGPTWRAAVEDAMRKEASI